jgi:5-deoxy-glucuronate isomerase
MGYHLSGRAFTQGLTSLVGPPQADLRWLGLGQLHLGTLNTQHVWVTGENEFSIDILEGSCSATFWGKWGEVSYPHAGERTDPFSGPPTMFYVPRQTSVQLTCTRAPLSALVVSAPSVRDTLPVLVQGSTTPCQDFGSANWQRQVYLSIGPTIDADRIMMGETHTPSGNWSSYPPHKHDVETDREKPQEEIYYFLFDPAHGFGMQYLWSSPDDQRTPIDEAYALHTGDAVVIPRGYHPNVVAPGFRMVTVWAFAGESRVWAAWSDNPGFSQNNASTPK